MGMRLPKTETFKPYLMSVSGRKALCYTPHTVFASQAVRFRASKGQVLDVQHFCSETETRKFDERDTFLTSNLRANSAAIGRVFDGAKLYQRPMYTAEDGAAFLCPLNSLDDDWLGFRDDRYWKLCVEVTKRAAKINNSPLMESAVRHLFTDYSANVAFASSIRKDGHMKMSASAWDSSAVKEFAESYGRNLIDSFDKAGEHLERYCPSKNPTKSTGINSIFPDGRPFSKKDCYYAPESLVYLAEPGHEIESAWVRYDATHFKDAWAEELAKKDGPLDWWLAHYREIPENPKVLVQAFFTHMLDVHTEAYRTNNPDPFLNTLPGDWDVTNLLGKLYKKDRDAAFEVTPEDCFYGLVDDEAYSKELRKRVFSLDGSKISGTLLKKRPMFPADTACFSLPFIFLFRCFLKDVEESPTAMPSLAKPVQTGYTDFFAEIEGKARICTLLDRRTCEQFMTDNFDSILNLFESPLKEMMAAICTCVVPSRLGPRVVAGGCASGTAPTTFLNATCGMFEIAHLLRTWFNQTGTNVTGWIRAYVDAVFLGHPYVKWGDWTVKVNLGTDDQVLYLAHDRMTETELTSKFKAFLDEYCAKRFLKHEVGFGNSAFGLEFNRDHVKVCDTLVFAKLFLLEKETNGDAAALKYWCRLQLLGDLHDAVAGAISDVIGGDLNSYELGARNYLRTIAKFGYAVQLDELFDEHSPTETLAKGLILRELDYDPTDGHSTNYSVEQLQPLYTKLSLVLNSGKKE